MKLNMIAPLRFAKWAAFSVCCFAVLLVGCSGSGNTIAEVSGVVTHNGEPMEGLSVAFYPIPAEGTSSGGPFSEGFTNASGKFTLTTRHGKPGAVVGMHTVIITYAELDEEAFAAAEKAEAAESKEQQAENVAETAELKKKTSGLVRIPKKYGENSKVKFDVPSAGTTSANFELGEEKSD